MEKSNYRRLIQLGKTTHCISLPKAWLEKYGIEKGSSILINSKPSGELILIPDTKRQIHETEITINTENQGLEELKRNIISSYINDYTKIILTGPDVVKKLKSISKISELLTATEIMDVEKDKIIIKTFFDANNASIKSILTRLNMMILSLFTQIKNVLIYNTKDYEFLKRENEINRLCFMGLRILSHSLNDANKTCLQGKDERDLLSTWMIIDKLEKIADILNSIGKILKNSKNFKGVESRFKKDIAKLISDIEKTYKPAFLSFYKHNKAMAHKIIDLCQENSKLRDNRLNSKLYNNKLLKPYYRDIIMLLERINRINIITKHIGIIVIDRQQTN